MKKNQGRKRWSFLDGPITANNPMGVHHAWGRAYKDIFQRYKAMKGFDQRFQNGFDCQGLWVEVEVEKEKGFKSKKDIEKFGIDEFVRACKARVLKYSKIQTEQSIRLGQWMDWNNSYYTMSDKNNYAIWNFLKICREKGLLYKGRDSVPWCPRCGTAISQHEILTEEYKEIKHRAVYFKLALKKEKNTYFLTWTTTPWTLPGNIALAVHPDLEYVKVKNKKSFYILLKEKADLIDNGEVIETFKGKNLEGREYRGLFDDWSKIKKHKVILWKDVNSKEGTGIVHIAPGCGAEDFQLARELNLPVVDLSDGEGNYRKGFGDLSGKFVGSYQTASQIFDYLERKGGLFKVEDYIHRYPICWRCKKELIFRVVDEWYISMDKIRKDLVRGARSINWIPGFGLDRELDWLKNMRDWLISKKRYWGLALPIFECQCGNFEVMGSKEELRARAVSGWDDFEGKSPHRPWIDGVKIKCSKCGKKVSRIKDVGNPWLDAGIVPFSTMPEKWFPAELVCESFPGQFKNWFYSLIVMSIVLKNASPAKTIFGYASVKDEKGEEMHKSKGNAVWLDEAVEKIGADPMRWMYSRQNPAYDLRFGYKTAEEIKRKLLTLYNVFVFFNTYVDKKEFPSDSSPDSENILDKWIVSKLNKLINRIGKSFDKYNIYKGVLEIEKFFIEDLSLWYLRRSRGRFHQETGLKEKKDKEQAIFILHYVLLNLIKIMAPVTPFFAEKMYQLVCSKSRKKAPVSVHLCDFPKSDQKLINLSLEEKMAEIRKICSEALALRAEAGIKVRQPLSLLQIPGPKSQIPKELLELIKQEVNVKKITFGKKIKLDLKITKKLEKEGEFREWVRKTKDLRKMLGEAPGAILYNIISTCSIVTDEKFLKEVEIEKGKKVSKESEIKDVDIKKEIKIKGKKHHIGIKIKQKSG